MESTDGEDPRKTALKRGLRQLDYEQLVRVGALSD